MLLTNNQQENKTILMNHNEKRARGSNNVRIIKIMHNRQPNSSTKIDEQAGWL
jgi:hypothetical protein